MDGEDRVGLAGSDEIKKEMERFFEHLERWKRPVFFFEKAWEPRCDVSETEDEVIVVVEIAGVSSENIDIALEGSHLVISGIRREPESAMRRNYRQMEISYGTFERVLILPARVDAEMARADYDNGFLEIRLPKVSPEPPREVEVNVPEE